jgi:diphthine-ammonia ligase
VSIAGQIPLVPQTMVLPAQAAEIHGTEESRALTDFRLQTVLSLQHLWRIGIAMEVQWFTYAIAYLPSSSSPVQKQPLETDQNLNTCARALIAAKAWSHFHLPTPSSLEEGEDEQNEEERDLWEEKYLAGTQPLSGNAEEKTLPDWEIVESTIKRERQNLPPFFAAEVEELPRGAGIEWGIGLGLRGAKGSIKVGHFSGHILEKGLNFRRD